MKPHLMKLCELCYSRGKIFLYVLVYLCMPISTCGVTAKRPQTMHVSTYPGDIALINIHIISNIPPHMVSWPYLHRVVSRELSSLYNDLFPLDTVRILVLTIWYLCRTNSLFFVSLSVSLSLFLSLRVFLYFANTF